SKDDLAAEACAYEGVDSWESWMAAPAEKRLDGLVRSYLTTRHRDNRSNGCLFAALGSEVVRQPKAVRHAFTGRFRSKLETLVRLVPGRSTAARRRKALATMAGLVGALTLSRAVDDPKLADELLDVAANTLGRAS